MGFPGVSSLPAPPGPPVLVLSCWQQLSHLLCPGWVTLCFSQQAGSSWISPSPHQPLACWTVARLPSETQHPLLNSVSAPGETPVKASL